MDIELKACISGDLDVLISIARETYRCTFAPLNTEANMRAYLDYAFDRERLADELSNENSYFYFLYVSGVLAGYMKLNEHPAQTEMQDPRSLEIERIYVLPSYQGEGLGHYLMSEAITIAGNKGKSYVWLGVWEKNAKAIQFYKKNGFYEIGRHSFFMGDDEQSDYLMRKDLI